MTTTTTVDEYQDIIDSRDIIARIEDLEGDETFEYATKDEREELAKLKALADEANDSTNWEHGEGLIRYSYFKTYAQELAEDTGAIPSDAGWPARCIDWAQAARELQMDYSSVKFGDITYWIHS